MRISLFEFLSKKTQGALCGDLKEKFLHGDLADGGEFIVEDLVTHERTYVRFPTRTQLPVTKVEEIDYTNASNYYVPNKANHPAVDSFMPPRMAVQITVSERHTINYEGIRAVMEQTVSQKLDFFWGYFLFLTLKALFFSFLGSEFGWRE